MARKRFPIFDKVSTLLKLSFLMHKVRKPVTIPKCLLLKKLRKHKEFKLLRHHHHHHQKQLFPSTSGIRNHFKNRRHRDMRSFFYLYWCLGNLKTEGGGNGTEEEYKVEALPMRPIEIEDGIVAEDLFDSGVELGESVDEKAERFINRFYHEMRMQSRSMDLYI